MMNCILVFLQVFAIMWLGVAAAVVPWKFIFPFIVIVFAIHVVLSAINYWSSIHPVLNERGKWRFALSQAKLGSVILHIALLIRFIFGDSSNLEMGYTWALISLIIGTIALIGAAVIQMTYKTTRLSSGGIVLGLAVTFLSLGICWWAVNEAFYVFYAVFGFWAILWASKAIPKVNRLALSTKTRLYWTIHLLLFWIISNIIFYEVTDALVFD